MMAALGPLLLLGPALYAVVWVWLRGAKLPPGQVPPAALVPAAVVARAEIGATTIKNVSDGAENNSPKALSALASVETAVATTSSALATTDSALANAEMVLANTETALASAKVALANAETTLATSSTALLFSVLVAARDEAAALPHLLHALHQQTLASSQFEVFIIDDHSTDGTAAVVAAAAETVPFALRLLALPPGHTGKKAALAAAVAQARAPWVVCTDADCRPGPGWLLAYADLIYSFTHLPIYFISGPVRLTPGGAWFDELLGLEFAGLVGVGGACIMRGRPTMCNGANLAFRRATFHEVGGYADNAGLASGDDEFLLHKMHQRHPAGIRFLADARAVVDTPAPATLRALLRQRVRWASKWPHYRTPAPRQLALLVLGANVSLALGLGLAWGWPALGPWVAAGWALKLGADAWLLRPVLRLLHRPRWLAWLLPLQLLYAPYALAVGLAGQRQRGYSWKGRQVQ